MRRFRLYPWACLAWLWWAGWAHAGAPAFQDGDRWVAVGDSITHSGLYHAYVRAFYATRFPDRTLDFHNAGIAGDSAQGALGRVDDDVLAFRPTVATILLGMNDVGRNLYGAGQGGVETEARRRAALEVHARSMRSLVDRLRAAGVRVVLLTPTPYDETAKLKEPPLTGVDGALAECARMAEALGAERHLPVVDFHGPMNRLNAELRANDPRATLIGADRVHPGEVGHFVMAYLLLKAQGAPRLVSELSLNAATGLALRQQGARVEGITRTPQGLAFTAQEDALPFPVPAGCARALELVPFMEEMNRQFLQVTGLPAGTYRLTIDQAPVATLTSAQLAQGINLATYTNAPAYVQARVVVDTVLQMSRIESGSLRTIAMVEKRLLDGKGDVGGQLQRRLATEKNPWLRARLEEYPKIKAREAEDRKRIADLLALLPAQARPQPHRYTLGLVR